MQDARVTAYEYLETHWTATATFEDATEALALAPAPYPHRTDPAPAN